MTANEYEQRACDLIRRERAHLDAAQALHAELVALNREHYGPARRGPHDTDLSREWSLISALEDV